MLSSQATLFSYMNYLMWSYSVNFSDIFLSIHALSDNALAPVQIFLLLLLLFIKHDFFNII